MRRLLEQACCLFASLLLTSVTIAQHEISGRMIDTDREALVDATITLKEKPSVGTTTGTEGHCTLALSDQKEYTIQVSLVDYVATSKKTTTARQDHLNFVLKEDLVDLGTVVVTGTCTPKLLKDTPIITWVITTSDLKKVDVVSVGRLLQVELLGIESFYSIDQQAQLSIRGFGGSAIPFLIDGERLVGETLNNVDYNRLSLDNMKRVGIVKGAASTLYDSNAVGGAINIIAKISDDPWNLSLNTRFGVHNDQRHGGTVGFNAGKFYSQTNVRYTNIDSYNVKRGDYTTINGNKTWNVKEQLMFTPNGQLRLTARAGYYFRERDASPKTKNRYRRFSSRLKGNYDLNTQSNLEVAYTFDQYDKSDYLVSYRDNIRDYSNVQHNVRALYNYASDDKNTLTVGADYLKDYLMSYQFKDNGDYTIHPSGAFGQFDWNPAEHFNVVAGLRFGYFSESSMRRFSSHLGLMYKIGNCSLRGSYAQGSRSPTLKETHIDFYMASTVIIYGNSDLNPETSHNFSSSGRYTKNRYNFALTGYYNLVHNRIDYGSFRDTDGTIAQIYTNTPRVDIVEIDASVSAKYPCGIGVRISYTCIRGFMHERQAKTTSTRPHSATVWLEYGKTWDHYDFNLSFGRRTLPQVRTSRYTSNNPNTGTEKVTYPGYTMWDLTLTQRVRKGINMDMVVNNLFNYRPDYYYANSSYTAGTNFSVGPSLDVDRIFGK